MGTAAVSLALMSGSALALTISNDFNINLTITDSCTVTADTDIDLGDVGNLDNALIGSTNFTVNCSDGVSYELVLDSNTNTSGSRVLANSTAGTQIAYNMFQNESRSVAWDDTTKLDRTGTGDDETIPVYVTVPADTSTPVAGDYSDTVSVVVTY